QSITQGGADLDSIPTADSDEEKDEETNTRAADVALLKAYFKETLGDKVQDVRESQRLAESAVCLVAPEFGPDRQMEKIMERAGQGLGAMAPILEINPKHTLITSLAEAFSGATDKERFRDAAWLLLGQARILDGELPDNPADYAKRVSTLMESGIGGA
ncbi:MAG: molecular chaperone HtpG, partial [Pseudomonadota bacterium]